MSRAYTKKEARKIFLDHMHAIVDFWANETPNRTAEEKVNGCAFSILAMIDGSNIGLPAMNISMEPHPDDKEYHQNQGENWFEEGLVINDDVALHEMWHHYEEEKEEEETDRSQLLDLE